MKLRIISDGTKNGTKVVDAATGAEVENVSGVDILITAGEMPQVYLELVGTEVDVIGEVVDEDED